MAKESSISSITGPDGSGKTTTVETVAQLLGQTHLVGVLTSLRTAPYVVFQEKKHYLFQNETARIKSVYETGQRLKNTPIVFVAFMARAILEGRFIQPKMKQQDKPDFLIQDRNRSIDPIVLFWTYVTKGLPVSLMMHTIEALTGRQFVDNLFLLTVDDPKVAIKRLERGEKQDHHETEDNLKKMQGNYQTLAPMFVSRGRIGQIVTIDTVKNDQSAVAKIVYQKIIQGPVPNRTGSRG